MLHSQSYRIIRIQLGRVSDPYQINRKWTSAGEISESISFSISFTSFIFRNFRIKNRIQGQSIIGHFPLTHLILCWQKGLYLISSPQRNALIISTDR